MRGGSPASAACQSGRRGSSALPLWVWGRGRKLLCSWDRVPASSGCLILSKVGGSAPQFFQGGGRRKGGDVMPLYALPSPLPGEIPGYTHTHLPMSPCSLCISHTHPYFTLFVPAPNPTHSLTPISSLPSTLPPQSLNLIYFCWYVPTNFGCCFPPGFPLLLQIHYNFSLSPMPYSGLVTSW